jgi:hypothetical protein
LPAPAFRKQWRHGAPLPSDTTQRNALPLSSVPVCRNRSATLVAIGTHLKGVMGPLLAA